MTRPRIHLIATGGTIASRRQPSGVVAPDLAPQEMLHRIPTALTFADISVDDFLRKPSGTIGLTDMLALAQRVDEALAHHDTAGIVITHGTGTLEQTAYFLDVTLGHHRPVVLTGAMRNPTLASDDGPMNLLNAIQVAACPRSQGLGVLVVMNGFIHTARDVTKCHSASVSAFQSPEFGPLGAVDEDYVFYARRPFRRLPAMMPGAMTARVERIPYGADSTEVLLHAALDKGIHGLVVEGVRLNNDRVELLAEAMDKGVVVVLANPFFSGRLPHNTYRAAGTEADLLDRGVIFSGTSGLKARIKLAITLSAGLAVDRIRELFHAEWNGSIASMKHPGDGTDQVIKNPTS